MFHEIHERLGGNTSFVLDFGSRPGKGAMTRPRREALPDFWDKGNQHPCECQIREASRNELGARSGGWTLENWESGLLTIWNIPGAPRERGCEARLSREAGQGCHQNHR